MKRRIVAAALVVSMIFGILPITASAAASVSESKQSEYNTISEKKYEIAPGITEYEIYKNTDEMDTQQAAHAMVISAESLQSGNSQVRVGYNDYNLDNIQSGNGWGMKRTTEQAQAMETSEQVNVVGAVNGDFFNMSNGQPTGAFVLNGKIIQQKDSFGVVFWVGKDKTPHITAYSAVDWNNVQEALGGNAWLVQDGQVKVQGGDTTKNPRTAVGITEGGDVVLYMVNGRQAPFSDGMTMLELAREMADLGCYVAMNLDGGGSSTFATQRAGDKNENGNNAGLTVRCRPSDGYERTVSSTLMVVSKVQRDGNFKTASISPYEEVYTPGSTIKFTATGADAGGGPATVPTDAVWSVTEGGNLGSINESTGEFTAKADAVGKVTVALSYDGKVVGTSDIELWWPDKLGFTNTSVSLDFGETSDLSFYPTYQGREVNYKDGDFEWKLLDTDDLTYKHTVLIEAKEQTDSNVFVNNLVDVRYSLTGHLGVEQTIDWNGAYGSFLKYRTVYSEINDGRTIATKDDGTIEVTTKVHNTKRIEYSSASDTTGTERPVQEDKTLTFSVGQIVDNKLVADKDNSLRGVIQVSLANKPSVNGNINVIIGMEPYVLMDFENHGDTPAKDYWTLHLGSHKDGNPTVELPSGNPLNGALSIDEMQASLLWMRDTLGAGVRWPTIQGDGYENGLVSADEDKNVRFGDYAFRCAWDFSSISGNKVAAAELGPSSIILVNAVQPTKFGMWIYVPEELKGDTSVIKSILVGGAYVTDKESGGYRELKEDGTLPFTANKNVTGTTTYVQYYSYDANGKMTGETLGDWAGKGWIWVEADVSTLQFPIGIQRGYTVRITSAQNKTKGEGYILVDNFQLIYGTNTNDTNNPVIESVTANGTVLEPNSTAVLDRSDLSVAVTYNDSAQTDKYASGIDTNTTKVYLDGVDISNEVLDGAAYAAADGLVNGEHTIKVRVKDTYGNETVQNYSFTIANSDGEDAHLKVVGSEKAPIGKTYKVSVLNDGGELVQKATVVLQVPASYAKTTAYAVKAGAGYTVESSLDAQERQITLNITKQVSAIAFASAYETMVDVEFNIPVDAMEGDTFSFSVPAANYSGGDGKSVTFSQKQETTALSADYHISVDRAILNLDSTITVTDEAGNKVANAKIWFTGGSDIGTTTEDGTLMYKFTAGGRQVIYATTENGGRSWNTPVVVNAPSTEPTAAYRIQNNAVGNGATSRTFTWLSLIGGTETAETKLRYAMEQNGLESGTVVEGTNKLICFTETNSGTAYRLNTVTLTGLTPNTTYWYQVQKGEDQWTEALSFTTASDQKDGTTSFFVFGDIQTNDTANLAKAVEAVSGKQTTANLPKYSFGIQTGDAIDQVNQFTYWQPFFTVMNAANFGSIDVLHTMGNHEYYGDNEGEIAGSIFALPETAQGSWYSVEYGSVYAAVVNNGGNRLAALEAIVADAAKSACAWKILVLHEPIYGTTDNMDDVTRLNYTSLIEEAGFSVVFSGDDHSYARTYPMQGGEKLDKDSSDGVVYYISGDLSNKNNEYHEYDHFAEAMPHSDIPGGKAGYGNLFLSVTADENEMKISAYKVPSFELVETYTRTRSNCQKGNHTYDSNSKYDMNSGELLCSVCGKAPQTPDADAQGLYATTDGKFVVLAQGAVKKNSFTMVGTDMYHSCADGYAHKAIVHDPRTCTTGGYITYECPECKATEQATTYAMPTGHRWDDSHICTECHTKGKSIEDEGVIVNFGTVSNPRTSDTTPSYVLVSGGVRPSTFVSVDGGKTALTYSNDDTLINGRIRDIYISWLRNNEVGEATVRFEGRGDYYGTRELKYIILPGTVENLRATTIGSDTVKLKWNKVLGAQYVEIYLCDKAGNILDKTPVAKVEGKNTCTLKGLSYDTEYCFKAAARAVVNGTTYNSAYWSNILSVTTLGDPALDSRNFITGGTVTNNGMKFTGENIDGTWYYFLPSSADLTKVSLDITVKNSTGENVIVSGPGGSQTLTGSSGTVDLTALTAGNDSSYSVSLQYGETRSKIPVVIMKSANIPAMFLTSKVQGQDRSYVDASKSNSTTADMKLVGADGKEIYNGELTQLKARGNSTFTYAENKSYQIKLGTPSDLLGTQEAVQTWVLLAGYSDATKIHDKLFKDLASELGMPYVASSNWVDLYYDGEYRGTYLLSEKNSVSSIGVAITDMESAYKALNEDYGIDPVVQTGTNSYGQEYFYTYGLTESENITGGYLIEINNDGIDEASGFKTAKGRTINVKSPEYAGQEAMKYISEYYQEFEDAVYAVDENGNYTGYNAKTEKYYYDYVDLNSLVQVFLLQELALNPDGFRSSVYFYKDADGIMYAGPIWDHDLVFGTGWEKYISSDIVDYHYLEDALIKIPSFKQALEKYYKETFAPAAKALLSTDGMVNAYLDVIHESVNMNNMLWPLVKVSNPSHAEHLWPDGTTYDDVTNTMKAWIRARLNVMDGLYMETPNVPGTPSIPNTTGGGAGGGNVPQTSPDGPKTTTTTDANGTVTEKTEYTDGTVTEKVTQTDGSVTERATTPDGVVGQKNTDAEGKVTSAEVVIPKEAEKQDVVTAPVEVPAAKTAEEAPEISVRTESTESKKVEIPVTEFGPGTVAVIVHEDGTEEVVRDCTIGENGVVLNVEGDVTLKIVDKDETFADVEDANHWASNAVEFVAARELFKGTAENKFTPNGSMTRGMMVTVLYRLAYEPETTAEGFTDVPSGKYYSDAVAWAAENGVVNGYADNTFAPDDNVSREQLVTILHRYAQKKGYATETSGTLANFADAKSVSSWAADAMSWAVELGLVNGTDSTHISPAKSATRAEVATILMRFCEKVVK